jgi:hypothetical protein
MGGIVLEVRKPPRVGDRFEASGGSGYNAAMAGSDEGAQLAAELRRIRDAVRERALIDGAPPASPPPVATRTPEMPPPLPEAEPQTKVSGPDASAVNASWDVAKTAPRGLVGRLASRLLAPLAQAQTAWNARQVRLDNELLDYVDKRFDATHRHYDRVLGIHGSHMKDIDERHLILQEELVAHVHDLVKRIDLVLGEGEKGRLSLEFALREIRSRLARLEEQLGRE